MKAVVLEKRNGYAAVLKEDGTIIKIKRDCQVGDELLLTPADLGGVTTKFARRRVAAAAAIAGVLLVGSTGYVYAAPVSYVTMDVNPSFEFGLNRFGHVVSMEALNEDAEEVAALYQDQAGLFYQLEDAITLTAELLYETDYLGTEATDEVLISAVSGDESKSEELNRVAKAAVEEVESKHGHAAEVTTTMATKEERKAAEKEGMSTGRYMKQKAKEQEPVEQMQPTESQEPQETNAPAEPKEPAMQEPEETGMQPTVNPETSGEQGEVPQGEAPQGEVPQGEAPQGGAPQGEVPQGEAPQGGTPGQPPADAP